MERDLWDLQPPLEETNEHNCWDEIGHVPSLQTALIYAITTYSLSTILGCIRKLLLIYRLKLI